MTFIKTKDEFAVLFKSATKDYFEKLQELMCRTSREGREECWMMRDVINSLLEQHNEWASRYEYEEIGDVR